jgi:hypothetical protein
LACAFRTTLASAQASGAQKTPPAKAQEAQNTKAQGKAESQAKNVNPPAANPAQPKTGTVAYLDVKNKKVSLPYGEPFTITGDSKDVQLSGGSLTSLLTAQTVAGDYTTSDGNKGEIKPSSVTGTTWQVDIGKLNADTSVTFNFQFTGTLSTALQETVFSEMTTDPAYKAATAQFITSAQGRAPAAQMAAATLLAQAAADVVTSLLNKKGLTPKNPADLKSALGAVLQTNIEPIFNLSPKIASLQQEAFKVFDLVGMSEKDFAALSVMQLKDKLEGVEEKKYQELKLKPETAGAVKAAVKDFLATYQDVMSVLNGGLKSALFTGSSSLATGNDQQTDAVSDLKKYGAFDVGALYSYRLSELRSFAMVHIYSLLSKLAESRLGPR